MESVLTADAFNRNCVAGAGISSCLLKLTRNEIFVLGDVWNLIIHQKSHHCEILSMNFLLLREMLSMDLLLLQSNYRDRRQLLFSSTDCIELGQLQSDPDWQWHLVKGTLREFYIALYVPTCFEFD